MGGMKVTSEYVAVYSSRDLVGALRMLLPSRMRGCFARAAGSMSVDMCTESGRELRGVFLFFEAKLAKRWCWRDSSALILMLDRRSGQIWSRIEREDGSALIGV